MTEENYSVQTGVIQFIESDYEPIPYTKSIWLPDGLTRKAVNVWARYWNRKGIDIRMIGTNTPEQTLKILRQNPFKGLSREFRDQRLDGAKFSILLNEYASKFQQRLWETEPLPHGVVGVATIPDAQDIVLHNACNLNRAEQESNTN